MTRIGTGNQADLINTQQLPHIHSHSQVTVVNRVKGTTHQPDHWITPSGTDVTIAELARERGTPLFWMNGPPILLIFAGGAVANIAWCLVLNVRNGTGRDYIDTRAPLLNNYLFCMLAGLTAYSEFLFFGMGETQMGKYGFSSWTIHMAFIIVFSNMWGLILHEWRGTSRRTRGLVCVGILVLVASTLVAGYGNYLKTLE